MNSTYMSTFSQLYHLPDKKWIF